GPDAFVLEGEPAAGAAQPRLHLVDDQQHVVAVAPFAQLREEALRRYDHAGLALDRLDQHGAGIGIGSRAHAGHVAEVEVHEARRERPEAGAVFGLARKADDGAGAAVEVAARYQDLGAAFGDALDAMAPAAHAFDRGFHRFGPGIHRQRSFEPRQGAQLFKEWAER